MAKAPLSAQEIIWGTADTVARITAIDVNKLRTLARDGIIRARKIGVNKQCPTLYKVSDVCDWIEEQPEPKFK